MGAKDDNQVSNNVFEVKKIFKIVNYQGAAQSNSTELGENEVFKAIKQAHDLSPKTFFLEYIFIHKWMSTNNVTHILLLFDSPLPLFYATPTPNSFGRIFC